LVRASNELLRDIDSFTSPSRHIPERKKRTALFKQAPDRLSQLQKLLKSEVKTTAIQRVPMVTSFMIAKSPSISTRSSTPVASDDEVCFNVAQKEQTFDKRLGQNDYSVSQQPLQGSPPVSYGTPQTSQSYQGIPPFNQFPVQVPPFISQPPVQGLPPYSQPSQSKQGIRPASPPRNQSLPSMHQELPSASQSLQGYLTSQPFPMNQSLQGLLTSKPSQEHPPASQVTSQPTLGFPPISQPGSSPFTLLSSFTARSENLPFPIITSAGFSSQPFSLHTTAPPPPPPPLQEHYETSPPTITKTPAEMAAEAALKRQDSSAVTTTSQNTATMSEAPRAPVVVITASEMPPSSLFFTAKSQGDKTATESSGVTSDVSRFAAPERSNSLPSNIKFPFSAQTTTGMKLPFLTQTPLTFSLSANKMAAATSTPVSTVVSSASNSQQFFLATTTSAVKLMPSLQTTVTTGSASFAESPNINLTKQAEETTEESDQSDNEHDTTLTNTTSAPTVTTASLPTTVTAATTIALPVLSKASTSNVSVSAPAAIASVVTAGGEAPPPAPRIVTPTLIASSTVVTHTVSATVATPTTTVPSLVKPTVSTVTLSTTAAAVYSSAPPTVIVATEASTTSSLQTLNTKSVTSEALASTTAHSFSLTVASSSEASHSSTLLKVPPNDKLTESDEESDLCDNVIDKVSSHSSIMTDDVNVVDDVSEGEMEPNGLCSVCCVCTFLHVL